MNNVTSQEPRISDLRIAQTFVSLIDCPIEDGKGNNCREDMIRTVEQALTHFTDHLARDLLRSRIERYRPIRYSV